VDTYTGWTAFGRAVILCMIQLGGLGFMSVASLVVFTLRRKVGLKQRLVMAQALSINDMEGVVRLQKLVLAGSFGIEAIGALILTLRFWPEFGLRKALSWGVFHSISAFCNAGFDIFGELSPGSSLMLFQSDPIVLLTISALIVLGGLGFFVWEEVVRLRSFRKCSVYTKLVLLATGVLLILGTVAVALLEWNNSNTLGHMGVGDKLLNSFFQSVTSRTAGFASISQAGLTEAGKAVTMVLMLIGGSSGSTAGGIKTVTLMVLMLFLWSRIRGKGSVSVFRRTIPDSQVMDAMTICGIILSLALFGGIAISASCGLGFTDSLYEAVSALATVGLTADVTGKLNLLSRILIIIYMYFGRVGVLTISLGFLMGDKAQERYRYAQTNLLIG
jgi:trk system potassium uptake protein TrkH